MSAILWICTVVIAINAAQSYILLTANMEDVQSIAKQMVDSPLSDQLKKIWRRASSLFNLQMDRSKMQKRADYDKEESADEKPSRDDEDRESDTDDNSAESHVGRRQGGDEAAKGNNASFYISSSKNAVKDV